MINTTNYRLLLEHFNQTKNIHLSKLFEEDSLRAEKFTLEHDNMLFDFSKNNITTTTLDLLIELAKELELSNKIEAMFNGEKINFTENRAVLHVNLRGDNNSEIKDVLNQMKHFVNNIHQGGHLGYSGKQITDIVNIGIGGSDLGPALVCRALKPYRQNNLNIHFISTIDGYSLNDVLSQINPETTIFIIASKTFTTIETITNAQTIRQWFLDYCQNESYIEKHFVAISTNLLETKKFGIARDNTFKFWDFVGGRYSLWSAIGLAIMLYIGYDNFEQMLLGARSMDNHFRNTKFRQNIPIIHALIGIWYNNFYQYPTNVISPYNSQLDLLPSYIQQLEMESNGKSVDSQGNFITRYNTCPIIWGGNGINGQHAYYQLLHQGTTIQPMDIIISLSNKHSIEKHHNILVASAYAQAEALMLGNYNHDRYKNFAGNRPTNVLLLPEITPFYLGMLIALYEHKTFVQGVIWQINSFDQMGVELGKKLAQVILNDINTNNISTKHDSSTQKLINRFLGK